MHGLVARFLPRPAEAPLFEARQHLELKAQIAQLLILVGKLDQPTPKPILTVLVAPRVAQLGRGQRGNFIDPASDAFPHQLERFEQRVNFLGIGLADVRHDSLPQFGTCWRLAARVGTPIARRARRSGLDLRHDTGNRLRLTEAVKAIARNSLAGSASWAVVSIDSGGSLSITEREASLGLLNQPPTVIYGRVR